MSTNTMDVINSGIDCLVREFGVVKTERFISVLMRERFDYTKWHHTYFDGIPKEKLHSEAVKYGAEHPYTGKGKVLDVR